MRTGMECLKLLLISGVLSKVAAENVYLKQNCLSDPSGYRLPESVIQCRHYNIRITIPVVQDVIDYYWGETSYFIEIFLKTKTIDLHYNPQTRLNISLGTATLSQQSPNNIDYNLLRYTYCCTTQILTVDFGETLHPGNYTLWIQYRVMLTAPNVPSFAKVIYSDSAAKEKEIVITNFVWDARRIFPCWDQPNLKATFNISVKHPLSYTVLSNMMMREQSTEDEMTWTHFHTTPLMPTYLVGIVMFKSALTVVTNDNLDINVWGRQTILNQLQIAHNIAVYCSNYISRMMNLTAGISTMDHVVVPSSLFLTKSNWGLYTYKESELEADEILYNVQNFTALRVVQRLVYHYWFGTNITPEWWNYMWLYDGIATFFALYITDQVYGHLRVIDHFVVEDQHVVLSEDVKYNLGPVLRQVETPKEIDMLFSSLSLKKATILIRMMYNFISHDVFWKGIRIFLHENQFKTVAPENLWSALREALNITMLDMQFDIWDFEIVMIDWLTMSNYPVLYVKCLNESIMIWQQHLYVEQENKANLWYIPITYTTESNPDFNETLPWLWLKPWENNKHVNIDPNGWIIFNLRQTGYYRVNYDMDNWQRLIGYLKSDNYTKIHPINRAQLIDDSYHLMLAGHLDSTIFLELSNYLKQERDYIAWYPMKRILSNMSIFLELPEGASIKQHMLVIMDDVIDDIGFDESIYDDHLKKSLRLLIAELACKLGNSKCLKAANAQLIEFLGANDKHEFEKIPSQWRNWTLCMGMKNAGHDTWMIMLKECWKTWNLECLEYLNCVGDTKIINNFIYDVILNYFIEENHERRKLVLYHIIEKHASKDAVLHYLLTNYHWLRTNLKHPIIDLIVTSVHSMEQLEKVKEFIKDHDFSQEEINIPENFKEKLTSNIKTRSKKIQAEINMFVGPFKININKTTPV